MGDKCVLVIDDEFEFMEDVLRIGLGEFGFRIVGETDPSTAPDRIESERPNVVLLDILFPEGKMGKPTLEAIKQRYPSLPVVMLTSTMADDEFDREDYRLSEYRYAKEGLAGGDYSDLAATLTRAIESARRREDTDRDSGLVRYGFVVGKTDAMRKVADTVEKVAERDCTVLIVGESGTGKELVARAIHDMSRRRGEPFIPLVCAAVPRDLLESELFGIERGVATGVEKRIGKVEQASGGTLFLDEIGDVPIESQIKLLRLIQERRFVRVGGQAETACDVRFIAATNQDLALLVRKGAFREDLFFRINVVTVHLPPLRERKDDIPALLEHFVRKENRNPAVRTLPILRDDVKRLLSAYSWPGNIRELENSISHAIALADENILQPDNFRHLTEDVRAPSALLQDKAEVLDAVFEGKYTWDDIKIDFASANETRRDLLLGVIERWKETQDNMPTSKDLAKLLDVSDTNMRQILRNNRIKLTDPPGTEPEPVPLANRFCKKGEYWLVTFEARSVNLKHRVGFEILGHLLQNPGKEIHCLDIHRCDPGLSSEAGTGEFARMSAEQLEERGMRRAGLGDAGEVLTEETIRNYKARLQEIRDALSEAERSNDRGRSQQLQEEKGWLEDELSAGIGLGGRTRKGVSALERARQSVSKNLHATKTLIRKNHPALFEHLERSLKIGVFCVYNPPQETPWAFE